jgi:hypothetical protein
MAMIFPHLPCINCPIIGGGNLVTVLRDCLGHLPDQQRLAVLRGPDALILSVINGMGTGFVGQSEIVAAIRAAHFPPRSKLWGTRRDFSRTGQCRAVPAVSLGT